MSCDRYQDIHRYHDGELPAAERVALEAHLASCPECRELLGALGRLSSSIRSASAGGTPTDLLEHIKRSWRPAREGSASTQERGVLRIAEWMTAAAAAVLIGAIVTWPSESTSAVAATPPVWQTEAISPPAEMREESRNENVVVAQWMADELSTDSAR